MTKNELNNIVVESLRDWFKKEKWVRISSSGNIAGDCGTSKNKKNPDRCLPKAKAQSLTKGQRAATAAKKKKAGAKGKTVVKNTKKATVKKETKGAPDGHYFTKSGNLVKGRMSKDAKERGARLSDPKDKQRSKVPKVTQYTETSNPQDGKAAPYGSGYKPVTKEDLTNLVVGMVYESTNEEVITEKDDRCTRLAKQKYDTWPSAYASGAVVRCRRGDIWKGVKEEVNEQMDIYDDIANSEFGMDYDQLGSNEKEWVRDEIDSMKMRESLNELNCKHGKYFCPHDKVYKCRKGPKKARS